MSIQLNGINCFYGAHQALFDITLDCPQGRNAGVTWPQRRGKSSLLRVLNLLEMPRSGTLNIAGNHFDFTKTPLTKRFAICVVTLAWCFSNTTCGRI